MSSCRKQSGSLFLTGSKTPVKGNVSEERGTSVQKCALESSARASKDHFPAIKGFRVSSRRRGFYAPQP